MLDNIIPAFGEKEYIENKENKNTRVIYIANATSQTFEKYCKLLEDNRFAKKEETHSEYVQYAAYQNENCGVFLNYFSNTNEMEIVIEDNCNYFSYTDICLNEKVSAQITQIYLEDFGMSYVIRLSDGRFIVIDGGREFEPDAKCLYECLKEGSPYEKPVIAAWIMSHAHSDHFHCFFAFMDCYAKEVVIEKFLFNFPQDESFEKYPKLYKQDPRFVNTSGDICIPRMLQYIAQTGAPIYTPHTGQRYCIGDAVLDIYSSMDDTIHCTDNLNATSLVIFMRLANQTILWATDASFSAAKVPDRYGKLLAADILQVPHHGFGSGTAEAQIQGYELIRPQVCFLPVNDYNAYTFFCIHREGSRHLMTKMGVQEMITGETTRTITLPYKASENGADELKYKCLSGLDNAGARTWIFTDLSTDKKEDFVFGVLNTTNAVAEVIIDIFFEDTAQRICYIKAKIPNASFKKLCIINQEDVESESLYFNPWSLNSVGIPETASFAVRFISNVPVVISHRDHIASYHSTIN